MQDVQDRRLLFPVITLHVGEDAEPVTFTAREGRLDLDTEHWMLKLHLLDSHILGSLKGAAAAKK